MAGKCDVCGKAVVFGHNVSHSNRKTNRMWAPNIQRRRVVIGDKKQRIYICTRCLRTQRKLAASGA